MVEILEHSSSQACCSLRHENSMSSGLARIWQVLSIWGVTFHCAQSKQYNPTLYISHALRCKSLVSSGSITASLIASKHRGIRPFPRVPTSFPSLPLSHCAWTVPEEASDGVQYGRGTRAKYRLSNCCASCGVPDSCCAYQTRS